MNQVIIMGRLTSAPRLKKTKTETSVVSFTLAVNRMKKDQGADFIYCTAFGKTADFIFNYSGKGKRALINGRLSVRNYEAEDGTKKTKTDVIVNNFDIIDWKDKEDKKKPEVKDDAKGSETDSEEIPF